MKRFNGFESKMMTGYEDIPAGGYVCKIMNAEEKQNRNGGSRLELSIDIAEGEYANFYAKRYREDTREDKRWGGVFTMFLPNDDGSERDGWAKNRFNNLIGCVEDANPGYHWDWNEKTLTGKKIALVFRKEEYARSDGGVGAKVKPFKCIGIGDCRDGKWGKYEDKLLATGTSSGYAAGDYNPREISDDDSDLPWID